MKFEPLVFEKLYNANPARVWKAITDKDEMKDWYFDLKDFIAETGFKFEFYGGPSKEKQYLHLCEITEVVPKKKLTYSWRYDGYKGISYVTFELFDKGGQTLLKLTHEGLDSFPSDNPDLDSSNFKIGWTHILNVSLASYLEKAK